MDIDERLKSFKEKGEIQSLLLEALGKGLNDKRFNTIAKLSRMERAVMDLTWQDCENKETIMNNEIIELIEVAYHRFNNILRTYNKEEI